MLDAALDDPVMIEEADAVLREDVTVAFAEAGRLEPDGELTAKLLELLELSVIGAECV